MKIDLHAHLAGLGTQESGCWLSPRLLSRPLFRLLRWLSGISAAQLRTSADQDWAGTVARLVRESELDRAVVLGFDGAYDGRGELDLARSQMIVPPSWVFEVCRRHPDALLPGPSVNPLRRDAMDRLEECIEGGAVLLKWLPSAQGMDPGSAALRPFYRRMADAGLPLLVHSGGSENTFGELAPALKDVRLLRLPLQEGVPVVCAHSGARVLVSRDPDQLPLVRAMLQEFPHFWLDNSGMANPSRFPYLARLARDPLFQERTLFGSDYPVPSHAIYYPRRLGPARAWRLSRIANPFNRDVAIKRALGYPDQTLTRAARVLPSLRRWLPGAGALLLAAVLTCAAAPAARAQLRPLDPTPWPVLEQGTTLLAEVGAAHLQRQRASLAGTEGPLLEAGNFQLAWRSGRMAVEVAGTVQRLFHDRRRFAGAVGGARDESGPRRQDVGDVRIGSLVRLTPARARVPLVLRFGTRLPTTSNDEGLDRDRTDFYALGGTRLALGGLRVAAEAGVGIHGTRYPEYEQADVLLHALTAEYLRLPLAVPTAAWIGQHNPVGPIRGNESLAELRLGARTHGRAALQVEWVRGLATHSPDWGLRATGRLTR